MTRDEEKAVQLLRQLLLGQDEPRLDEIHRQLQEIRSRIVDREALISSLDPVIADLLERKISTSREDMVEALAPIMSDAIRQQAKNTKDDVVDALYPVIGETIRKSISEAIHDLVHRVNYRIERSLIRNLIPKRLQSRILGVDVNAMVFTNALPFRIDQVFMIHRETGLLIAHASNTEKGARVDQELISGMLTAIRDFVSTAFHEGEPRELSEIQYGDGKILLEKMHHFYLAVVISGHEPLGFVDRLGRFARHLHNRFYVQLRQFDGDDSDLAETEPELNRFIEHGHALSNQEHKARYRPKPYLKYFALAAALFVLFLVLRQVFPPWWQKHKLAPEIESRLAMVPGLDTKKIDWRFDDDRLIVEGQVSSFKTRSEIENLFRQETAMTPIDNRLLVMIPAVDDQKLLREIQEKIIPYREMKFFDPKFVIDQDHISIHGFVPTLDIKRELGYLVSETEGVRAVHNHAMVLNELELSDARIYLHEQTLFFAADSVSIKAQQKKKIDHVASFYRRLQQADIKLVVRGFSDDAKGYYENLRLSKNRAENVASTLKQHNIPKENIVVLYYGQKYPVVDGSTITWEWMKNSRVEFDLIEGEKYFAGTDTHQ